MSRNIIILSLISIIIVSAGCGNHSDKNQSVSLKSIGNVDLYTFTSDDQYFLSNAYLHVLPGETSMEEALESLGRHLSESYFLYSNASMEDRIVFEVLDVREIKTEPTPIRIAIINMIDREEYAMGHFFQGSTGGQTTFSMLGATFTQPHLDPPLLDGLILLYNGKALQELDHINLSGILTPRLVRYVAKRAINNTRMEFVGVVQKTKDSRKMDL